MDTEADWISRRVELAEQEAPVPDGVAGIVRERLAGVMSQRPLKPKELSELATALLNAALQNGTKEAGK